MGSREKEISKVSSQRKDTIYVVNETASDSKFLKEVLTHFGFRVDSFLLSENFLDNFNDSIPDLILMGVKISGGCGIELCSKIKSNENTKDIPIIFLSSYLQSENIENAFSAGGFDYITKPFHLSELIARVKKALNVYQRQKRYKKEVKERT